VFAIDVATGQKLWEWLEPYAAATFADNTVPPPVSVYRNPNGAYRLFSGDMEGNLWELDASTGMNANVYFGSTCAPLGCKFTAFSTQSDATNEEPVTTNIAVGRLPVIPADSTSALTAFSNATFIAFGTAGANWVSFNNKGQLHLPLIDARYRKPYQMPGSTTDAVNGLTKSQSEWISSAQASGVLLEKGPVFPLILTGAHLYGAITISGQVVFFETTRGAIPQDINWLGGLIPGGTYSLDLGAVATTVTGDTLVASYGSLASYGGVTVYQDTSLSPTVSVLTAEVSKLTKTSLGTSTPAARTQSLDPNSGGTGVLYTFKGYLQRLFDLP
jgi:type IV pilus assembly protein PilY1